MATLSKADIELFNFIINDPESGEAEKKIAKEVLAKNTPSKEIPTRVKASAKKPVTKKATSKKSSVKNLTDLEKKKMELLKKTGKTEEQCEKIIAQYRALKSEKKTQVKKDTARKVTAKKRTTKLKKEGKTIQGTTEKNVEATLDTASKKVVKKIDKEVEKIEKTSKTEKQVEKKISSLVTQAVRSNKKLLSDTAKELAKVDKNNAKQYLMSLKKEIESLLSKYADGGTLPTPFGQAGLVGETGTLNEVDLFAMGGTLPQGVHQYYAQTYNPAYPTPHGYAKGGNVDEGKVYELKAYFVDVEKYSFDGGVLENVHNWDSGDYGQNNMKFYSKQDLYNQLSRIIYRDTDKYPKKEFYGMDEDSNGNVTLTYDTLSAYKNDNYVVPSDLEVSLWKQGEMELFNVRHFFVVDVYKKERLEFAKGGMTTSDKHAKIIADLEKIQSEVTDRPPYVYERDGQLFVSSEEGDEFSDYDGEYYEPMYIDERLEAIAEKNGGYWDWENAGSIVFVDDSFAKGGITEKDKESLRNSGFSETEIEEADRREQRGSMYAETPVSPFFNTYAKGGKTQGYNDRLDESLGNRNSVEPLMMQSYKDRRDESKGMEKAMGNRPYSSVGTMDKMAKGGEIDENKAHYYQTEGNIFVDSNFVNMSKGNIPNSELKHYGYGDFYLETPKGNIDFFRVDKDIEGFVGRTHKLRASDELGSELFDAMIERDKVDEIRAYAKGGYVYRESDDEDATEFLNKKEVMELIEEHNKSFETKYKTIEDFNKGEQKANGIRSIEKMAKGGIVSKYKTGITKYGKNQYAVRVGIGGTSVYSKSEAEALAKRLAKRNNATYVGEDGMFAKGGKIGFDGLAKKVAKRYEGKSVPKKFQKEYGKTYDKKEAMEVGKKVAGKVYRQQQGMAKGGKTQGYNDKLDESLGNRNSVEPIMKQSYKDRRNESEAMEKKGGKRKYASVKTMDKGGRKKRKTPMTLAKEIRKEGEKWQDAVKRASAMLKKK